MVNLIFINWGSTISKNGTTYEIKKTIKQIMFYVLSCKLTTIITNNKCKLEVKFFLQNP